MPIPSVQWRITFRASSLLILGSLLLAPGILTAQSQSVGGLSAKIVDSRGVPVPDATVTVERGGTAVRTLTTGRDGTVSIAILTPGQYSLLAEQFGFQPVRMRGVTVVGGGSTHVSIKIARRPPPITTVEEQASNATISGASGGRAISGEALQRFNVRNDISNLAGAFSDADQPRDGRYGAFASGNGLRPFYSSLFVDGVHETLLRHPGIPGEPVATSLFATDAINQLSLTTGATGAVTPGTLGSTLLAQTASGSDKFTFRPWATFGSAKLGGRKLDNPNDSNATSIQVGAALGGNIKGDTATWLVRGDYQQLQQPTASPFELTRTTSDTSADLIGAIRSAAQTVGHKDISQWLAPTVRSWKGGSGSGRLDWRFGPSTVLAVRAAGASWTETNPLVGTEAVNGAGASLKATDISVAATLTMGSTAWTSETRVGIRSAKRDWTGASLPFTSLVGDAVAFGGAVTLPGHFKENGVSASETATFTIGSHSLQGALSLDHRSTTYDWLPGGTGRFTFGDLASFAASTGAFYQTIRANTAPDIGLNDVGFSLQDDWSATPQLHVVLGARFNYEGLPATLATENIGWERVSGLRNFLPLKDNKKYDIGPHAGFAWDASGTGNTVIRGAIAIVPGQFDPATLSEVAQNDGDVTVRRATGALTWGQVGSAAGTSAGQVLSFFGDSTRKPRSYKADLSLSQHVANGTTINVSGSYRHADFLLQRQDVNLVGAALATGSDGRPIYGVLQQFGGLLTPKVGSNRRFSEFDMVSALTSTGYNDYYEASIALEHRMTRGLDLLIGYTYSKTTDNLPGSLSGDPADQLSPFPSGLSGARWEDGRSDLDIPHRVAATLTYTTSSKSPLAIAGRFRYRSGLPFTPGFRTGVDANGDGSGANDPASLLATTPGMAALTNANSCLASQAGQLAERNSCRDDAVSSLDLHLSLPVFHGVAVTVDGFNVVSSTTGLYDHAAVLVDPKGTISIDATGHTVLPLIANPGFGQLLSRRGDPRVLRIGFRVEN